MFAVKLLLGLLVAMHDELVQEATRLALRVLLIGLGLLGFSRQMAGRFIIDVLFVVDLVEVRCVGLVSSLCKVMLYCIRYHSCHASTASS